MTLKIDRKRGPDANRRVEIWMAPSFVAAGAMRFTDTNEEVWDSILAQLPSDPPPPIGSCKSRSSREVERKGSESASIHLASWGKQVDTKRTRNLMTAAKS